MATPQDMVELIRAWDVTKDIPVAFYPLFDDQVQAHNLPREGFELLVEKWDASYDTMKYSTRRLFENAVANPSAPADILQKFADKWRVSEGVRRHSHIMTYIVRNKNCPVSLALEWRLLNTNDKKRTDSYQSQSSTPSIPPFKDWIGK